MHKNVKSVATNPGLPYGAAWLFEWRLCCSPISATEDAARRSAGCCVVNWKSTGLKSVSITKQRVVDDTVGLQREQINRTAQTADL